MGMLAAVSARDGHFACFHLRAARLHAAAYHHFYAHAAEAPSRRRPISSIAARY